MPETDYYDPRRGPFTAYQEGQDTNTKRARDASVAADAQASRAESLREARMANDETAYSQGRAHAVDAEREAMYPRAPAAPAAPAAPGTGLAAPSAPPSRYLVKAKLLRDQAGMIGRTGDWTKANVAQAEAESLEATDVYMEGRQVAQTPAALDAAFSWLSRDKEFPVVFGKDSHGRYIMSVTQPNGKTTPQELSKDQLATIMGAFHLMEKKYVPEAMGKFASVSTDLAAAVGAKNTAVKEAAVFNNKTMHEESQDDSQRISANASMVHAQAARDRVGMEKTKQSFGTPVNVVDKNGEAVVMQPYMVNGKMTFEKVELPDGARFPKQAPDTKFTKTGEGAGIMQSTTGKVLFKLEEGIPVPAEKDIFSGKKGQEKMAEWEDKGVMRGVVEDKDGVRHWAYSHADDPKGQAFSTPAEAMAKGKPSAAPSKLPAAGMAGPGADTSRYTRTQGARGGWEYTATPRGRTKAEFAEQDAKGGN